MAWRPNTRLIAGEFDNTSPGKITGWLDFVGLDERVKVELVGDFHRDIRGACLVLMNPQPTDMLEEAREYMECFCLVQRGVAGDITAGMPPQDYVNYAYVEWYSEVNGRVVLELHPHNVNIVGTPIPWQTTEPLDHSKYWPEFESVMQKLEKR